MSDILDLINAAEAELNRDAKAKRVSAAIADQRQQLLGALTRLVKGQPTNLELQDMMQDLGRIPVTKDTLEKEAGIARQRFSGKMSKHPIISELVKAAKPEFGVSETTTKKLRLLADQNRVLSQALRASRSACAVHILELERLQKAQLRNARKEVRKAADENDNPFLNSPSNPER